MRLFQLSLKVIADNITQSIFYFFNSACQKISDQLSDYHTIDIDITLLVIALN